MFQAGPVWSGPVWKTSGFQYPGRSGSCLKTGPVRVFILKYFRMHRGKCSRRHRRAVVAVVIAVSLALVVVPVVVAVAVVTESAAAKPI